MRTEILLKLRKKYIKLIKGKKSFDIQISEGDAETLREYIKKIKLPNCYVEIGTHEGGSALVARDAVKDKVEIYAVDILDNFRFKRVKRIKFIHSPSVEAAKDFDKPIQVLFIDGDHNSVKYDFEAWSKYVVKGGHILFHDYAAHSPLVKIHCEQILKDGGYELVYRPPVIGGASSIFQIKKL